MRKLCVAIFAALATFGAAHAQQNPNCFNASLPPTTRIDACSSILDADPRHAQAHQARAVAWLEMRNYDEAIEDFTQAIAMDPKYVQSFYGRGLAWEKRGRLQKALDDFQYFVSVNPSVEGLAAVARVTSARQRIEAAAMKVGKAHAAEPTSPFVSPQPSQPMAAASPQIRRLALVIGNDLPPKFHPVAIRASADVTPFGAG
ncbi:tetratricopeptide (TPR) repeat protein [Bradyrhizobium sp. LB7.1]